MSIEILKTEFRIVILSSIWYFKEAKNKLIKNEYRYRYKYITR